jgi:2-hydroxy-3-oxopropionate reductase
MGRGMARNLLKAGFPLTVFDVNPEAIKELVAEGAVAATMPKGVAEPSDVVITVLPSSVEVEAVVLGADGLIEGFKSGATLIDCSTISPMTVRKVAAALAKKGARVIDAGMAMSLLPPRAPLPTDPGISGAVAQAIAGTMRLLCGADPQVFAECQDVLDAISQEQLLCGPVGCGMTVKLANNLFAAAVQSLYFEVFCWAAKNGVEPALLLEVFKTGACSSPLLSGPVESLAFKRKFRKGVFPIDYIHKDFAEAQHAARAVRAPLLITGLISQLMEVARAQGWGEWHTPIMLRVFEQMAQVEINLDTPPDQPNG